MLDICYPERRWLTARFWLAYRCFWVQVLSFWILWCAPGEGGFCVWSLMGGECQRQPSDYRLSCDGPCLFSNNNLNGIFYKTIQCILLNYWKFCVNGTPGKIIEDRTHFAHLTTHVACRIANSKMHVTKNIFLKSVFEKKS